MRRTVLIWFLSFSQPRSPEQFHLRLQLLADPVPTLHPRRPPTHHPGRLWIRLLRGLPANGKLFSLFLPNPHLHPPVPKIEPRIFLTLPKNNCAGSFWHPQSRSCHISLSRAPTNGTTGTNGTQEAFCSAGSRTVYLGEVHGSPFLAQENALVVSNGPCGKFSYRPSA